MQITYGSYSNDFTEIMDMIDKRLNDKGKNWRHVFKVTAMVVRETCLMWYTNLSFENILVLDFAGLLLACGIGKRGHLCKGKHVCRQDAEGVPAH